MTKSGPKAAQREDVERWIIENGFEGKYKLIEFEPGSKSKLTFLDIPRNVFFRRIFNTFKDDLRRKPNRIFDPSKEEQKQINRASCEERYGKGITSPFQMENVREKSKKTIKERFGVDNAAKNEDVKKTIKQTILEKYEKNPSYFDEIKEKARQTSMKNHGVEHPSQSKIIRQKTEQTCLEKYGSKTPAGNKDVAKKSLKTKIEKGSIVVYEGKTLTECAEEKGISVSYFQQLVAENGYEFVKEYKIEKTNIEQMIECILREFGVVYEYEKRIEKKRADFFIPSCNLIIEADGLVWHSELRIKDKKYHINKRKTYESFGYRPLFFRSSEILKKQHIVKSIIQNALGLNKKLYARKCEIGLMDGIKFLEQNHLMGKGKGRTYCLSFNEEIVACCQVKYKLNDAIEISRFCTKNGFSVVGGFSRLLKHIIKEEKCKTIITFIDRRYGTGDYLRDFGFVQKTEYLSFKWTNGNKEFHRMMFPGSSGEENGLVRIWDCGQAKWELNL